jgi:hypothetical protein
MYYVSTHVCNLICDMVSTRACVCMCLCVELIVVSNGVALTKIDA